MTEMRVLTVRQPWADAIIFGGKDVENRTRNIAGDYRGPVAIHSGLYAPSPVEWLDFGHKHPRAMDRMTDSVPWHQPELGVILGVVDLVGVHPGPIRSITSCFLPGKPFGPCSEWADRDAYHLELANPRALEQPLTYTGGLGLRRLNAATETLIQEQLS